MNKFFIFSLVLMSHFANAQIYVKAGGGYAFPLPSQTAGTSSTGAIVKTTDPQTGNYVPTILNNTESIKQSYHTGINGSVTVGYMFSDHMGFDLAFSFTKGREQELSMLHQNITDGIEVSRSESRRTMQSNAFYLSPTLMLMAGEGVIRPYVAAGPVFGKVRLETEISELSYVTPEWNLIQKMTDKGGLSLGMRGTLGVLIKVSETIGLFAESTFTTINFSPKEGELTQYEVNGQNELPTLNVNQRWFNYVDRIVYNSEDDNDRSNVLNEPAEREKVTWPMSTIALNAGVRFKLGTE